MDLKRSFIKNSGAMVLANALAQPLLLVATLTLARLLGPSAFGVYSFAFTVATLAGLAAGLGTDNILIREMNRAPERRGQLLASAAMLRVTTALGLGAVMILAVRAVNYGPDYRRALTAASPYVVVCTLWYLEEAFFKASLEIHIAGKVRVAARATLLAGIVAVNLITRKLGIDTALAITLTAQALPLIVVMPAILRRAGPALSATWRTTRFLLSEGWPLAMTDIFVVAFVRLDILFLSHMSTSANVGEYYAAARLSDWLGMVTMASQATALPLLTQAFAESAAGQFGRVYQTALDLPILVIVPASVLISFQASHWSRLVYGAAYLSAAPVLSILVWTQLAAVIYALSTTVLIAIQRQRTCILLSLITLATSAVLNLTLIPIWGTAGAALATSIASGSTAAWMFTQPAWRPLLKALINSLRLPCGGAITMVLALHLPIPWYAGTLLSILSYLAVIWAFRRHMHPEPPTVRLFANRESLVAPI